MKKNILKIVVLVSCVICLIGLFLPYEKSIDNYRKELKENPTAINIEEVNFKNSDVVDISIMENFKVYRYAMSNSNDSWMKGESVINVVITIILIAAILLVALFVFLNKSIVTIIFSILIGGSSLLMNYDIVDRGVIPSSTYTYGISYYLYIIFAVIMVLCSIIQIIKDKKDKKLKEK